MKMVKTFRMTLSCVLLSLPFAGCDNGSTTVDSSHDSNRQVSLSATTMRSSIVDGDEVLSEGAFKVLAWQRDSTEVSSGVFTYTDNLWVGTQTDGGDYLPETVWFQGASGGQKPWATLPTYYWPDTFVACDFYAIYPTTAPNIEELPREGSARPVRYIDYDNNDRQTDLLLAATTTNSAQAAADAWAAGGTDGMAKLLFHHVLTRVAFFGIKQLLSSDPLILHVTNIFGNADMNWNFKVLYNPGILPFVLVSLLTMLMHGMRSGEAAQAVKATFRQISGAAVALLFGIAMVNLYRYSGSEGMDSMLYMMADAMAGLFRGADFIAAPLIGVLGAFMSGSNTVSNTLFASIQFETATILGISQVLIVALQAMGGAIGNMICIHNIVAVCATTGTNGNEGRLIRTNIIPCLIYAFTVAAIVGIFLAAGVNPMPELLG